MMKKRAFVLGLFLLLSVIISGCAQQQQGLKPVPASSSGVLDTLGNVLTFQFLYDLGVTTSPISPIEGFIRFLLLILLFAVLYKGAELLKLGKNVSVVIALVISLISVIFIPSSVIVAAAASYGTIVSLLILALPIVLGILGYFLLKEHHWLKFVIVVLLIFTLYQVESHLDDIEGGLTGGFSSFAPVIGTVNSYIDVVIVIMWILGFITLAQALGSMGGSTEYHPNFLRRFWDQNVLQKLPMSDRSHQLRHAKREETRLLNDLISEKRELEAIETAEADAGLYGGDLTTIGHRAGVSSSNFVTEMETHFTDLQTSFNALDHANRKWKSAQRRESQEFKRLIDEMNKNHVSQSVQTKVEADEQVVLQLFVTVQDSLKAAAVQLKLLEKNKKTIKDGFDSFYATGVVAATPAQIAALPHPYDTTVQTALTAAATAYNDYVAALGAAKTAEQQALTDTASLSDFIKKNWLLETPAA